MLGETPIDYEQKNKDMIHYQKINIFGEPGVGKSSFILHLKNYEDDNFVIEEQNELKESFQSINSNITQSSLVEQVEKIKVKLNKDDDNNNLYLNVYETNIDRYDPIKMNLETLLFQTECIIIMWDNNVKTFENIPNLIKTIKECLKNRNDRNIPFILLQNKTDLNLDISRSSNNDNNIDIDEAIEELKKEELNIIFKKISLLNNKDFCNILLDIARNIDRTNIRNKNDVIDLVKVDFPIKKIKDDEYKKFNEIKISLLGDSNTGKTSFLYILSNKSIDNMISTVGLDSHIFYAYIKNEKFKIKILDTTGQENYRSVTSNSIKDMDGFLLFFNVTKKESFNSIDYWRGFINDNNLSKEIILLANKIDESENREVKKTEAKEYAEKNNIKYIECSCKYSINIYEALNEIILMSFNRFQEKEEDNQNPNKNININNGQKNVRGCLCYN